MQIIDIAVIEDDPADRQQLKNYLNRYGAEKDLKIEISEFVSGEEFLRSGKSCEILFLDIEMPGRNGIEIAKELRRKGNRAVIVLVTNMVQYAIHGYEVKAADYIVKPVSYPQLFLKMPDFISQIRRSQKKLTVKTKEGMLRLSTQKIIYIESFGHDLIVHLSGQNEECPGPLKKIEEELSGYGFVKCSQSCLVNMAYVDGVFQDTINAGGNTLPLSRREKKNFLLAFTKYNGGNNL